jgi:hypothetical protein
LERTGLPPELGRQERTERKWYRYSCGSLELEATFAGCVGECFNFAVETGAAPIENDRGDAGRFRLGSEGRTEGFGPGKISGELLLAQLGIKGAEKHERRTGIVVDRLRVDVLRREAHREAGTNGGASDFLADSPTALLEEMGFANGILGSVPGEKS